MSKNNQGLYEHPQFVAFKERHGIAKSNNPVWMRVMRCEYVEWDTKSRLGVIKIYKGETAIMNAATQLKINGEKVTSLDPSRRDMFNVFVRQLNRMFK